MTPHDATMPLGQYAVALVVGVLVIAGYFGLFVYAAHFHRRGLARLRAHRQKGTTR